ncbi:glycoside hydrolase family 26 protein [Streptomyces sp. NPDC001780]
MAHRQRRRRTTWPGLLMAAFLVSGVASPVPSHAAEPDDDGRTNPPPAAAPALGAYLDYGPTGVRRIAKMQKWLGGTELRVGHTYLPGDVWENIEGKPSFLADWATWRKAKKDRMFVLNVPMLEHHEKRARDKTVRRELRRGARGSYDKHFATLARRLVRLGVPDTVIVLGWEMNGVTYRHRCGPDPASWRKYWRRIVSAMRSVPGQKFRFDFAPNRGRDDIPWTSCYPGDDVVDILGMDSYDQPPAKTFDEQVNEPYGLRKHVEFAAEHGKVISYPEWGLFRHGDNPEYVRRMLHWFDTYKPLYNTVTDYCPHGVWQCAKNPESSKVFRSTLYGQAGKPPAPAEPPPTEPGRPTPGEPGPVPPGPGPPTDPADPWVPEDPWAPEDPWLPEEPWVPEDPWAPEEPAEDCEPMNLGSWIERWLGGPLCVPFTWQGLDRGDRDF